MGALLLVAGCGEAQTASPEPPLAAADLAVYDAPLSLASWKEPGAWPQDRHDPMHSGRTTVDLGTWTLEMAWKFQPSVHARLYAPTYTTWSSPTGGTVAGRPLVFLGSYDHNLYAVDVRTGEEAWRFTAGAPVFATPALGRIQGRPVLFAPAADRTVYALDAATGEKIWSYETRPWTFTSVPSVMSSPTVVETGDRTRVYVGVWNADKSAVGNVQRGELYCFNADDGKILWKQVFGATPASCPAVAPVDGRLLVFCAAQAGVIQAYDALSGKRVWKFTLDNDTRSAPSIGAPGGIPMVYIGTRFNSVYGLDARTGARRWRYQTGNWVDASPGLLGSRDDLRVVVGSYDFSFYALPAGTTGKQVSPVWAHRTGNWAHTSPVVAQVNGKPAVLGISWDAKLYLLDGEDGTERWSYRSGALLWSHVEQGDAVWPSPAVATADGTPYVYYAGYDGVLYALRGKGVDPSPPVAASNGRKAEEL